MALSVVGGLVYPRKGRVSWLSRGRVTWPFARASLADDSITLGPRGVLAKVITPITVGYADLIRVERVVPPRMLPFAEGLRLQSTDPEADGLYFATWRSDALKLVHGLREAGVVVDY